MPLPRGVWKLVVNGEEMELRLLEDAADGTLTGTAFLDWQLKGFFSEAGQTIVMTATVGAEHIGTFTGSLMRVPFNPRPGQDVVATLVGQVQVSHSVDLGANHHIPWTARRNVYGRQATFTEVV